MATLALAAGGAYLGGAMITGTILGMTGAQIGWMAGSLLGSFLTPTQKMEGPRLNDLRVQGTEYGQPIPWVAGGPRVSGQIIWASEKREIENTEEAGKGGGGQEYTTYTYEVDLMIMLTENEIKGVTRIWSNGELVWNGDGGSLAFLQIISNIFGIEKEGTWKGIKIYKGTEDQMPDPIYEAAIGVGNAPAYRGRSYVVINSLDLGNSGFVPNLTFEIVTKYGIIIADVDGTPATFSPTLSGIEPSGQAFTSSDVNQQGGDFNANLSLVGNTIYLGTRMGTPYSRYFNIYSISIETGATQFVGKYQHQIFDDTCLTAKSYAKGGWAMCFTGYNGGVSTKFEVWFNGQVVASSTTSLGPPPWYNTYGFNYFVDSTDTYFLPLSGNQIARRKHHIDTSGNYIPFEMSDYGQAGAYSRNPPVVTSDRVFALGYSSSDYRCRIDVFSKSDLSYIETLNPPGNVQYSAFVLCPTSDAYDSVIALKENGYAYILKEDNTWELFNDDSIYLQRQYPSYNFQVAHPSLQSSVAAVLVGNTFFTYCAFSDVNVSTTNNTYIRRSTSKIKLKGIGAEPIKGVLDRLMARAGYDEDDYDNTDTTAITKPVRGLALSQVSPTRAPLEMLQSAYFFEGSKSDKIYIRRRQTTPAASLTYDDLGAASDIGGSDEPLALNVANELEVPAQISLTYYNTLQDYNTGTEHSDRILSSQETNKAIQVPLGMLPAEAKGVADAMIWDSMAGLTKTTISVPLKYAYLEPGDVINVTDQVGNSYRLRILTKRDTLPVLAFECALDDVNALSSAEITDEGYISNEDPALLAPTLWEAMDIPILRDADNAPGFYFAIAPDRENASDEWKGAVVGRSWDDVSYENLYTSSSACTIGYCLDVLGNWTGGNTFDETNTFRVVVQGQLSSSTRSDMLLDISTNALLVGNEIVRFRTAALISSTADGEYTYRLSGLLRGQRGTEWAIDGHGSDERCVLLNTKMRRVETIVSQIGLQQYVKAVTFNKLFSSAVGEAFTDTGVAMKPFSPANPRALENAGDLVVTWQRRTRLSYRYGGLTPSVPLGEVTEKYRVKVYDGLTLVRTTDVTSETWTYAAADITADGFSSGATINFEIMQLSEIVGEGYAATTEGIAP